MLKKNNKGEAVFNRTKINNDETFIFFKCPPTNDISLIRTLAAFDTKEESETLSIESDDENFWILEDDENFWILEAELFLISL